MQASDLSDAEAVHIQRLQSLTTIKHISQALHFLVGEAVQVETLQQRAAIEHIIHDRDFWRSEAAEVERLQGGTVVEHISHIRDLGSVEMTEVEAVEQLAVVEHRIHTRSLRSVEVFHACDVGQRCATVEPTEYAGWYDIGERCLKGHVLYSVADGCGRGPDGLAQACGSDLLFCP